MLWRGSKKSERAIGARETRHLGARCEQSRQVRSPTSVCIRGRHLCERSTCAKWFCTLGELSAGYFSPRRIARGGTPSTHQRTRTLERLFPNIIGARATISSCNRETY